MDVRGALAFHGGDVELVDITPDGTVRVRLQGACSGCPMADMTVSSLIESTLVERVPGVTGVVNLPR
ncbi:NifU family protein [Candidatus Uhrbacteria bacterium]|nr:NifU family protein [Candidatus Uhrbacteria bacterium]